MNGVDPSGWKQPVSGGNEHPPPVPLVNGVRQVTPDPYTEDNPDVRRNFGRKPGGPPESK